MTTPPARVLHLEDSDLDAELIRDRLEQSGLPVTLERVEDRTGFVSRLATGRYDLILSDYQVPGFDALDALELAKGHLPAVPFIFVSGALGEDLAVETLRRGATDYILKERLTRLAPAVERALAEGRAEADRRQAEDRLRVALVAGRMGTWTLDLTTGRMDCSDTCRANYGRRPGERFTYDDLASSVLAEDQPGWRRAVTDAVTTATDLVVEYRTLWPDGSVHWVHVRGSCSTVGGRTVTLSGVSVDVTDRRRSEQMARFVAGVSAALADLTDTVSTLQKVAGLTVPTFADWCAVDLVDETGGWRRVAVAHSDPVKLRAYCELIERYPPRTGDPHSTPSVIRTGVSDLLPEVPDQLLVQTAHNETHLQKLREMGLRSHILVPIRSRGQTLGVITFISAESGRRFTPADLEVAQDLADRSSVAIQNAALYHELRQADRRKDEFLATLAHELRNPLAPIRTGLQAIHLAGGDQAVVEQVRGRMERQTNQLVRLVDDLMDVSRISQGKMTLKKERVELAAVVGNAVETSRPPVEEMGHEVAVDLPAGPLWIDGDATRLSQVFMNLLTNAAKYSERGGRIRLTATCHGGTVEVVVKDGGIGIPPDKLSSVFELFSQVDRSLEKSQGGLGIGLSLVKRLVEMHGGGVEARSDGLGKGSEFAVRLPLASTSDDQDTTSRSKEPALTSALRILIADDNRDGADSLAEMLELLGHSPHAVYGGEEAVGAAAELRPEVILLDIGMPKLNGYDVCRRIRQHPWGGEVVLIALTGWGQAEDVRRSREAGFDHHLVKPVAPGTLLSLLRQTQVARQDRGGEPSGGRSQTAE